MQKISDVALYFADTKEYPSQEENFRPSKAYPEYPFQEFAVKPNLVYDAVRECLHLLGLDAGHYGALDWNPLGELIRPGDHVLIKPNMVMDYNQSGEGTDCLYTQPSVVAAVIDYAFIALKGKGRIVIGDAPMQECRFEKLIQESGYQRLLNFYRGKGISVELVDFRELKTECSLGARHQTIIEGSHGTVIDLKKESEFEACSPEQLSRLRITNYDPERLRTHHQPGKHEYYISDYVLDADVVINMPKPKTHRKAGVTIALKNLVGINVRKEYLPHHTMGSVEEQGDEYARRSCMCTLCDRLYDQKNHCEGHEKYIRSRILHTLAYGLKILIRYLYREEMEGSWYGNHTISKTIVDLNKILLYADKKGNMCMKPQRKVLHIADLVISGEKEGPVAPSPKPLGVIAVGLNAMNFDLVVGGMMGADMERLPVIQNIRNPHGRLQIKGQEPPRIFSNRLEINGKLMKEVPAREKWGFIGTRGWQELFDREG